MYYQKILSLGILLTSILHSSGLIAEDSLPLKPTRNVSFVTDEGSALSIDVSPDGKALIFSLLGDL